MKRIFTLVLSVFTVFFLSPGQGFGQPVNTYRSFSWDSWVANQFSKSGYLNNFGPDLVKLDVQFTFSGIANANTPKTYTYANQSGRLSSLKIEKLPGSEDTLFSSLTFNKDLYGFNIDINPYNSTYVVIQAYNKAGTRIPVKGVYNYLTDSVPRKGDTLINNTNQSVHVYFTGPVAQVTFKVIRSNAASNGMEFALEPASWFNTTATTANPDLAYSCDGNEVLVIMDASSSIDATEKSQLINAVQSMLNTLQYYAVTPNYISIVEFCRQAKIALPSTMITPAAISPGGVIYDYLNNTNGNGYYSTNALYGGQTNWSQAFKYALDQARTKKPNLLIFFTDGAPNRVYEDNIANNTNFLQSASWGMSRTSLYADTLKKMGIHLLGVGTDKINTTTQDFYFRNVIEMNNPIIYDYLTPPPSNISTADYVTVSAFPYLEQVFNNLFVACLAYLPVTFSNVQVQQHACVSNTISWKMDNEEAGTYYSVEKSTDGVHYSSLGRVDRNQASGPGQYSFDDRNLNAANMYYRVKGVSTSGKPVYSKVVMVQTPCLNNQLSLWPNPVGNGKLSLRLQAAYTGTVSIAVYDMTGRLLINQAAMKNQQNLQLDTDVQGLPRGMYTLMVSDNNHQVLFKDKFVKQ